VTLNAMASAFTMYFTQGPVTNMIESGKCDSKSYAAFWQQMLAQGIYLAPAGFECAFTSFAHTDEDFARTLDAARKVRF
jgi:glutamate-1-semialdehyde 2,1-aminomutase